MIRCDKKSPSWELILKLSNEKVFFLTYNRGQNILRKTSPPPISMLLVCVNNLGVN